MTAKCLESTVVINGRNVLVEWTPAAARELSRRTTPLFVELELYFSCLVKKFVHFRDDARDRTAVAAGDNLLLYFRPVTSTACSFEVAERLGRQPEMELHTAAVGKIAPRKVSLDFAGGAWRGSFSL
ncbi:MAG: hypothetical protein CVU20_03410 [Betaproteobacteria bacterium HGW-Betaproteobacteria-14]|nr:MAG: hypothetical protein CVU20_03410 [Betaproteobacteria bacterium HGW-Betaproteobacteria-14]